MARRPLILLVVALAVVGGTTLWLWHRAHRAGPLVQRAQAASIEGRSFPGGLRYPTLAPFQAAWGSTLALDRWRGRQPLVVNVWASWCTPCKKEVPLLQQAWERNRQQVQFVGIDFRDKPPDAAAFVDGHGMTYPTGIDPRGTAQDSLHVLGVPTTFFIDRHGRIAYERIGELTQGQLTRGLNAILPSGRR